MSNIQKLSLEDQCLVHRVLYYVFAQPVISDRDYDMMERAAVHSLEDQGIENHPLLKPGSDQLNTYPNDIVEIAKSVL